MKNKISASGLILSFLCLLWVDVFPWTGIQAQSEFQKALEAGKKLYESGDHEKAIIKLFEAQNLAREKKDLAEACFHISLCYYALGESENCLSYLRKAFEAYPEKDIDERLFPPRFVGLFYQMKRDAQKVAQAKSENKPEPEKKTGPEKNVEKKTEDQKPPAAMGKGKQEIPAKKKGKFPWLIAGGVAVAGGALALLLLKKETPPAAVSTVGNIAITSTPTGAKVLLDGTDTGQTTNCTLTNIAVGVHVLNLVLDGYYAWEGSIEVKGGQTANVAATLVGYMYEFVAKWGSQGSGDGQMNYPRGITVDSFGYVYVTDDENFRIQKFTSNGGFVNKWGSGGSDEGQLQTPGGIAVDNSGFIYVTEWDNHRIQKFTSDGGYVSKWGSLGSDDSQFYEPHGIAVDGPGYIYVADTRNHRIQKFSSAGSFVAKWGSPGSGDGQLNNPQGIAVDGSGYVYVVDTNNQRIQKFSSGGSYLTKWGSPGSGDGQLNNPQGIAVDGSGYVYVLDTNNHRIQKFRLKTTSPLAATITYTPLRIDSPGSNSARRAGFFSDPRIIIPPFLGAPDMFNVRQAPTVGFSRTPGSLDDFFSMPGMTNGASAKRPSSRLNQPTGAGQKIKKD